MRRFYQPFLKHEGKEGEGVGGGKVTLSVGSPIPHGHGHKAWSKMVNDRPTGTH